MEKIKCTIKYLTLVVCVFLLSICTVGCGIKSSSEADNNEEAQVFKEQDLSYVEEEVPYWEDTTLNNPNEEIINQLGKEDTIDITEKMYVTWINEIYVNSDDYIGRKIKIEGMYLSDYFDVNGITYHYVYRVGPGCCGNDGSMCGFEFVYDGGFPKDNDWIEVIGTLEEYEEDGEEYLRLRVDKVTVKEDRGNENVYQ